MTTLSNPCSICGEKIVGSYVGTGDGTMRNGGSFAHPECYRRRTFIPSPEAIEAVKDALREAADEWERLRWTFSNGDGRRDIAIKMQGQARAALAKLEARP